MATAAAAVAMTVGSGTAQAKPGDALNKIFHSNKSDSSSTSGAKTNLKTNATTATPKAATSGPDIGSVLSSIAPSIYNPGPFTIGPVTNPKPGPIVKPPTTGKPFTQITGIQLPIWTVNNGTPVTPF